MASKNRQIIPYVVGSACCPPEFLGCGVKWSGLIGGNKNIAVVGGGGKTGLIEALEAELQAQGRPALVTVTTRLGRWQLPHLARVEAESLAEAQSAAGRAAGGERLLLAGPCEPDNLRLEKVSGLPLGWFAELRPAAADELVFLIEADGSAGLPLKAHRENEPLIPQLGCFTIAVLGLSVLTRPWRGAVHRPEILAAAIGPPEGDGPLAPEQVAAFIGRDWAAFKPDLIFLNQADVLESQAQRQAGQKLFHLLAAGGWKVAAGSLKDKRLIHFVSE
ncbi:putative selenium-dependent hydroxylase accessory protein YqeC [Deltaproteobacteria bacterium OttesenSCG-928-K17]|nr:putative selenium-dependent hydroxylase accessory protein YqeC [Deltaproteobacteria bacterium OttesenSCG-928-K17]